MCNIDARTYGSLLSTNNKFCTCALNSCESHWHGIAKKYQLLCKKHFKWNKSHTYPDWFIEINPIDAAQMVVYRMPLEILEAVRYRAPVHLSTGVTVPLHIQYHLSVGIKYMFPPKVLAHRLFARAYDEFCDHLRWRIKFLFTNGDNVESDYNPDYEVPHKTATPDFHIAYIEGTISGKETCPQCDLPQGSGPYRP